MRCGWRPVGTQPASPAAATGRRVERRPSCAAERQRRFAEYWVVDVTDMRIVVHRDPIGAVRLNRRLRGGRSGFAIGGGVRVNPPG